MSLGKHAFLLQGYYVKDWAENMMMHVLVEDAAAWWRYLDPWACLISSAFLQPHGPKVEPWGLTVTYQTDPSGVLWHFAQVTGDNSISQDQQALEPTE